MKKFPLSLKIIAVIGVLCWIISLSASLPLAARVFCSLAATVLFSIIAVVRFRKPLTSTAHMYARFSDYCKQFAALSDSAFLKQYVTDEVLRIGGEHAVARSRNTVRMIHVAWYVPMLLICAMLWFYKPPFGTIFMIATIVFVNRIASVSTVNIICRKVKKHPDADLEDLIKRELEPVPSSRSPLSFVALLTGSLAVAFLVFFATSNRPYINITNNGNGTATIMSYRPSVWAMTDITIPETVDGLRVVAIDGGVFEDHHVMRRITLPDSIERMGGETFKNCDSLESFTAPPLLKEIRGNTFESCDSLADVTLHNGIIDIHAYAFQNCSSLKAIALPEMITEIHTYTFADCSSLQYIAIPEGVVRIAAHAFDNCDDLTYVYIPDSIVEIRNSAFRDCAKLESIYIPPETTIDERAFKDSPTEFLKKRFTDEQEAAIDKEVNEKEPDILYYIDPDKDSTDPVHLYDTSTALIADDKGLFAFIDNTVHAMHDYGEVREYLLHLRDENIVFVEYVSYSKVASDITHTDYYVSQTLTVSDMLDICEQHLEEE